MPDLHVPSVTTLAASLLGLIYVVLSLQVIAGRFSGKVDLGDTGNTRHPLFVAVRSHANFAEYVPLSLLLIGLLEVRTGPSLLVKGLAAALVLARLMHPFGMRMKAPNPFRAGGVVITLSVILISGLGNLFIVLK
jgi:uncharacterized membrane protein YecN with MAPEG domain